MCNGWRHHSSCTCGWGGEGHRGAPTGWLAQGRLFSTAESYTNPNASCPECGAHVFFYRSPYGGAVFFDELGPPWPKHPCTDKRTQSVRAQTTSALPNPPRWQAAGWSPLLDPIAVDYNPTVIRLEAVFKEQSLTLYLPKLRLQTFHDPCEALCAGPILAIAEGSGAYRIELLGPTGKAITLVGFESTIDALNLADQLSRPTTPTSLRVAVVRKKH